MRGFSHVDTWIFDLDNTLYPASCRLFDQIDVRMGEFVSRLLNIEVAEAKLRQREPLPEAALLQVRHVVLLRVQRRVGGQPAPGAVFRAALRSQRWIRARMNGGRRDPTRMRRVCSTTRIA